MPGSSHADEQLINLLCGPRCLSTATMYSFAQRSDTVVFDEPLYAHWLAHPTNQGIFRPYREELLRAQDVNGENVMQMLISSPSKKKPIAVAKHIVKQLIDINKTSFLSSDKHHIKNVFVLRDPLKMIQSWGEKQEVHQEGCTLSATSLPQMLELFDFLTNRGAPVFVLDSDLLRAHPREILSELCMGLDIPFQEEQLHWPAGPKAVDGLWASLWYQSAHSSTGFNESSSEPMSKSLPPALTPAQLQVYRSALPFYDALRKHAIGVDPLCPSSCAAPLYLPLTHPGGGNPSLTDPRNRNVLAWVGDRILPREHAKVSCFDSTVQGGDAVWEGVRVYDGRVFKLDEHIDRLIDSSKAMAFAAVPSKDFIQHAVFSTLRVNGMRTDTHMRLTLSRGAKITSSMNPMFNIYGCTLIILPEWKPVGNAATYDNAKGIRLITAAGRRNSPQCVDSKIHHCNLINNILPKIQANNAGVADALMLDTEGFVSETNACNVFMIKKGVVFTPHADFCLPGVTRATVIQIICSTELCIIEKRISLAEFHSADEIFTTGTMGELSPVVELDGRCIGDGFPGPLTLKLQKLYKILTENEGVPIPE